MESSAQVDPPLSDIEKSQRFLPTCKGVYYERMCVSVGQSFDAIIRQGEAIEAALKSGRITDNTSRAGAESSSYVKKPGMTRKPEKKEGDIATILPTASYGANQYPPPVQAYIAPVQVVPAQAVQNLPAPPPAAPPVNNAVRVNQQRQMEKKRRIFTPLTITMAEAYNRLLASGQVTPVPALPPPNVLPRSYNPELKCIYHSGQVGHDIESCFLLKHKIRDLLDTNAVKTQEAARLQPNVNTNPLPNHGGVNVLTDDQEFVDPSLLIGPPGTIVAVAIDHPKVVTKPEDWVIIQNKEARRQTVDNKTTMRMITAIKAWSEGTLNDPNIRITRIEEAER